MPEILAQHSALLVDNNTIDEHKEYDVKDDDSDDRNEKEHLNYGHVDDTKSKYAPKFKHQSKMFHMEMKPAGSTIRLKCAAEGVLTALYTNTVVIIIVELCQLW